MNVDEAMVIGAAKKNYQHLGLNQTEVACWVLHDEVERLRALLPPTAHTGVRNGPGAGDWSVFAEKVVAERDAARAEVVRLREKLEEKEAETSELESETAELESKLEELRTASLPEEDTAMAAAKDYVGLEYQNYSLHAPALDGWMAAIVWIRKRIKDNQ